MNKFVELTAIILNKEEPLVPEFAQEPIEDDLERTVVQLRTPVPPENMAEAGDALPTYPVMINPDKVREFYPRKRANYWPGTRIVFDNGAAVITKEDYANVKAAFERVGLTN